MAITEVLSTVVVNRLSDGGVDGYAGNGSSLISSSFYPFNGLSNRLAILLLAFTVRFAPTIAAGSDIC